MSHIAITDLELITAHGHTTGHIEDANGNIIEESAFGFKAHEDLEEWERLADQELERNGYTRTSDWRETEDRRFAADIRAR